MYDSMGSRLLKRWIHQPIRDCVKLQARQQTIAALMQNDRIADIQPLLQQVGDMERILARVALRSARPRISLACGQPWHNCLKLQKMPKI